MYKVRFGKIYADSISMNSAIERIIYRIINNKKGYIVTPNVDHIVLSQKNKNLQEAYKDAFLSIPDGMPLLWMSRIFGFPLVEKVSGSDLIRPLLKRCAEKGLRVYLLGAAPGIAKNAAEILSAEISGLKLVGTDSPPINFDKNPIQEKNALNLMLNANPDIVLIALGAPKQELLMHRWYQQGVSQIMVGVGGSLDFIAGKVKRAPKWMSNCGFEWLYRITQDPKRLIHRYLIQDIAIIPIFIKMMMVPKSHRVFREK